MSGRPGGTDRGEQVAATTASPRPWRTFQVLPEEPNEITIMDANGIPIAGPFVTRADADLIVEAVNSDVTRA